MTNAAYDALNGPDGFGTLDRGVTLALHEVTNRPSPGSFDRMIYRVAAARHRARAAQGDTGSVGDTGSL